MVLNLKMKLLIRSGNLCFNAIGGVAPFASQNNADSVQDPALGGTILERPHVRHTVTSNTAAYCLHYIVGGDFTVGESYDFTILMKAGNANAIGKQVVMGVFLGSEARQGDVAVVTAAWSFLKFKNLTYTSNTQNAYNAFLYLQGNSGVIGLPLADLANGDSVLVAAYGVKLSDPNLVEQL